jgi:hypothetical protein
MATHFPALAATESYSASTTIGKGLSDFNSFRTVMQMCIHLFARVKYD